MRSNGLATILLMIPVLTVPALAIFGIPQFAPVVASPLDEGRDSDRESRVGNSANFARDELLGEVDGFGSEPDRNDDSLFDRRSSSASIGGKSRSASRRAKSNVEATWDEAAAEESAWSNTSIRHSTAANNPTGRLQESPVSPKNSKRSLLNSPTRNSRRSSNGRSDSEIQLVSATDENVELSESRADEESERQNSRSARAPKGNSSSTESRSLTNFESASEALTWKSAVERLNQLEIHKFRIEPGRKSGQFVFICSYTPPDMPRVSYRFEAGADEPLKAIDKVLEQITEWQKKR